MYPACRRLRFIVLLIPGIGLFFGDELETEKYENGTFLVGTDWT
jgi:hypothetical protein